MASMRVHELAKEFDMSSGDLLDRLKEMKIPAKSMRACSTTPTLTRFARTWSRRSAPAPAPSRPRRPRRWPAEQEGGRAPSAPRRRPSARPRGKRSSPSARPPRPPRGVALRRRRRGRGAPGAQAGAQAALCFREPRAADRLGEGARRARAPGGPGPRPRREGGRRGGQEARCGGGSAPRP